MPKTAKKQAAQCNDHEFVLTPLRSDLYLKQSVMLSFCKAKADPKYKAVNKKNKIGKADCLCCPVFNKDNNYATSTFILPQEKQNYIENQTRFKLEHQCRIKEHSEQKGELLIPKPKTKQSYCNVCRTNYEDYLEHIRSQFHKISIRRAPFNRFIKELEAKYDSVNQGRNSRSKNNFNTDTTQNCFPGEQEMQMLGMPNKKFKKEFSFTPAFCYSLTANQMGNIHEVATFPHIPMISHMGQIKQIQSLPVHYFNTEISYQLQAMPVFNKNDTLPTTSIIPYQPMSFNYNFNPNMFFGFPMLYCSSLQNFPHIQNPTFVNPSSFSSQIPLTEVNVP